MKWLITISLTLILGFFLPLGIGIWLPDVFGQRHTLCSKTTSTGDRISIVHYWNNVDFYNTELHVTAPDGTTSISILDGDASKTWSASIEIDPSEKSGRFRLPNGRVGELTW